ncbi:MAG: hypothetical protein LW878_04355 [Proteobacteria bacterium]|jgi:hypothetical protein|nr:hypothetical protein [Pseudomonadota bacterium]
MAGNKNLFPLLCFLSTAAIADEELLLINEAQEVAKSIYQENVRHFGFSPKDCTPVQDSTQLLTQLIDLRDGASTKCRTGEPPALAASVSQKIMLPEKPMEKEVTYQEAPSTHPGPSLPGTQKVNGSFAEIIEEYSRTKKYYNAENTDSLFERISKAYIRNLQRLNPH